MEGNTVVFKFDGPDVNIQSFGKDFVSLVKNISDLVESCGEEEVRFVSVENNCITFRVLCSAAVSLALCLGDVTSIRDVGKYNAAVKNINTCMSRRNATLEYADTSMHGKTCCFSVKKAIPFAEIMHSEVCSTMAIYGELVDVGGASPNAHIQSGSFQGIVKLDVDREMAKNLARKLYDRVGVMAKVTVVDGNVASGKVLEILDFDPEPIDAWLEKNEGKLGAEAFRNVDVEDFIARQRI